MKVQFICMSFLFFSASCTKKGNAIKETNRIEFYFPVGDTVYKQMDSSKTLVEEFIKVLNGKEENRKCNTNGSICFYSNDSIIFSANFSIDNPSQCQYIINGDKAWKLTYRAGMHLSETQTELIRKNEENN